MVMGFKRSKKIKKLPELVYSRSLRVEKKIKKNSRYKGKYVGFVFAPGSCRCAYYASGKKKHKISP
jgi:hypothetical protein